MVSENWWDCAQDALGSYCLVFDAVYTPKDTLLLKDAADVGAVTVSGEEMFFRQAFRQFQHFTNLSGACLHYFQLQFIQCLVFFYAQLKIPWFVLEWQGWKFVVFFVVHVIVGT